MFDLTIFHEKARNLRFTDAEVVFEMIAQAGFAEDDRQIANLLGLFRTYRPNLAPMVESSLGKIHKLQCRCAHHQQEQPVPNGQHLPEIERAIEFGRQLGEEQNTEDSHY